MNNIQKIFVMVGVGSLVVFLITIFLLDFDGFVGVILRCELNLIPCFFLAWLVTLPDSHDFVALVSLIEELRIVVRPTFEVEPIGNALERHHLNTEGLLRLQNFDRFRWFGR